MTHILGTKRAVIQIAVEVPPEVATESDAARALLDGLSFCAVITPWVKGVQVKFARPAGDDVSAMLGKH